MSQTLLTTLQARFEKNRYRHVGIFWNEIELRLHQSPALISVLEQMEASGGEPDVLYPEENSEHGMAFYDCSAESPAGRRSLCYDRKALDARAKFPPAGNALESAQAIGCSLLNEAQYRFLQSFGAVDTKTSSWIDTPADIRALGGALFAEFRYGHVFVFHNGAGSYYAARGFRGRVAL
jgi:hypothetical protein